MVTFAPGSRKQRPDSVAFHAARWRAGQKAAAAAPPRLVLGGSGSDTDRGGPRLVRARPRPGDDVVSGDVPARRDPLARRLDVHPTSSRHGPRNERCRTRTRFATVTLWQHGIIDIAAIVAQTLTSCRGPGAIPWGGFDAREKLTVSARIE